MHRVFRVNVITKICRNFALRIGDAGASSGFHFLHKHDFLLIEDTSEHALKPSDTRGGDA